MFEDRDFLLRQLRNLIDAILGEVPADLQAAEEAREDLLRRAASELLGPGGPPLESLEEDALVAALCAGGAAGHWRLTRAASVLAEAAALLDQSGQHPRAAAHWARSLRLYLEAATRPAARAAPAVLLERVPLMLARLEGEALPARTRLLALGWLERVGRLEDAEDLLFAMVADGVPGAREQGRAMLQRLLALPDEALEDGGLPREDVQEALEAL